MAARDPNSGPLSCVAIAVHAEPTLQPPVWQCVFMYFSVCFRGVSSQASGSNLTSPGAQRRGLSKQNNVPSVYSSTLALTFPVQNENEVITVVYP